MSEFDITQTPDTVNGIDTVNAMLLPSSRNNRKIKSALLIFKERRKPL